MKKYEEVPYIISGKDLDYLVDMFNWNYGAYKSSINMIDSLNDKNLANQISKSSKVFLEAMKEVLITLEEARNGK